MTVLAAPARHVSAAWTGEASRATVITKANCVSKSRQSEVMFGSRHMANGEARNIPGCRGPIRVASRQGVRPLSEGASRRYNGVRDARDDIRQTLHDHRTRRPLHRRDGSG